MMRISNRLTHRFHWLVAAVVALSAPVAAFAADPVEGEAEAPPLLNVDPGMYFWQILLFLLLFGVLAKWVWPHILTGLQQREQRLRDDLTQAEQARKEADETLQQYKTQLAEARKESQQIVEQSRGEAQKVADQLKAQTQEELQQMRQRVQREIEAAKEEAVADVYERTAELATHIAGRILQRELSVDDQKALVESSLNELERAEQSEAAQSVGGQA